MTDSSTSQLIDAKWLVAGVCLAALAALAFLFPERAYRASRPARDLVRPVTDYLRGRKSVAQRLAQYGEAARDRFQPAFEEAGVAYPPDALRFVGLKRPGELEVYARSGASGWRHVSTYDVKAASGDPGPKLREGDRQVPEGVYEATALNPNSSYHLSIKVGYPNERDREFARRDGRDDLGGDIFIHGDAVSIGCLAMGDTAIEELFVMTADTGLDDVDVLVAPVDFRTTKLPDDATDELPEWIDKKYDLLREHLGELPTP